MTKRMCFQRARRRERDQGTTETRDTNEGCEEETREILHLAFTSPPSTHTHTHIPPCFFNGFLHVWSLHERYPLFRHHLTTHTHTPLTHPLRSSSTSIITSPFPPNLMFSLPVEICCCAALLLWAVYLVCWTWCGFGTLCTIGSVYFFVSTFSTLWGLCIIFLL